MFPVKLKVCEVRVWTGR